MARRKKKARSGSIVSSRLDHSSSPSHIPHRPSDSDSSHNSDGNSSDHSDDSIPALGTAIVPHNRKRPYNKSSTTANATPVSAPTPLPPITYVLSIFAASEMKKAVTRRNPKTQSFQLGCDESWDTLKAQMLAKIDESLVPRILDFADYEIQAYIPRLIPKPGISFTANTHYSILLDRVRKIAKDNIIVNIVVIANTDGKENIPDDEVEPEKAKKKGSTRRDPATLPGNMKKASNVQQLQDNWKCQKKQPSCLGMYCYVNDEGSHLPLSNERLDCWASAMVILYFIFISTSTDRVLYSSKVRSTRPFKNLPTISFSTKNQPVYSRSSSVAKKLRMPRQQHLQQRHQCSTLASEKKSWTYFVHLSLHLRHSPA